MKVHIIIMSVLWACWCQQAYLLLVMNCTQASLCRCCRYAWATIRTTATCSTSSLHKEVEVVAICMLMEATVCLLLKWSWSCSNENQRSLSKWNGRDCDVSMRDVTGFYCCHGIAIFLAAKVIVWTRGGCKAVSPTTWEWASKVIVNCLNA